MKKRKIKWNRVAILLATLYLIIGTLYSAYDSHVNPQRFQQCVEEGVMFWWE